MAAYRAKVVRSLRTLTLLLFRGLEEKFPARYLRVNALKKLSLRDTRITLHGTAVSYPPMYQPNVNTARLSIQPYCRL